MMVRNDEGLTKTYNRFHDPNESDEDIVRLRELHDAMDRAVLDAYGWTDIQPTCEFILDHEDDEDEAPGTATRRRKPYRYRWPDVIRDEVLGRLLALNTERAAAEAVAGTRATAAAQPPGARATRRRRSQQPGLLADAAPVTGEGDRPGEGVSDESASATASTLAELIGFVTRGGRVCPLPPKWMEMYQLLPRDGAPNGMQNPGLPLILGAWGESHDSKRTRLASQLRFAAVTGCLDAVGDYLRRLEETDWFHEM